MTLASGTRAPDFTLTSSQGEMVTLSKRLELHPIVLFFYPKDDSPGCTVEACTFRDRYTDFADAGADVIGISSDSAASHERFASRHRLPMTLLSDPGGRVRALYDVRSTLGLLAGRATFVIDSSGVIRHTFQSQLRFAQHVVSALDVVRQLDRAATRAAPPR